MSVYPDHTFATGQRVKVVEVLPEWDVTHHRLGTEGTVTRGTITAPRFPSERDIQVTHDDGERWAYAPRSLERVP